MKWNQKTTLETQMLNCSGRRNEAEPELQNESVLDVCGDGKITADFATTLPRVSDWRRQFS